MVPLPVSTNKVTPSALTSSTAGAINGGSVSQVPLATFYCSEPLLPQRICPVSITVIEPSRSTKARMTTSSGEAEVIPDRVLAEISRRTSLVTMSLGSGSGGDIGLIRDRCPEKTRSGAIGMHTLSLCITAFSYRASAPLLGRSSSQAKGSCSTLRI